MQWETEKEIQKARNRVEARKVSRFNNSCSEPMAPVLLPGKSHGQRSLVGCSPWGRKELDTTETSL